MDVVPILDRIGEAPAAALFGLFAGMLFGVSAQRSRFCLRAATVEFARGRLGPSVSVWLLTFSTALVWVQGAQLLGWMDSTEARMMAVTGSWSGAIIGGLVFGIGMVLARGCSGRLLVLASTGNLRSVMSGLIFAVFAQMSLSGALAPLRNGLARLWVTEGGRNMELLATLGLPQAGGLVMGLAIAVFALFLSIRNGIGASRLVFASGVGFSVAVGWILTYTLSQAAFDPVRVESMTFTGPSARTLMFFLQPRGLMDFGVGLIPGVVLGAFAAAALTRELKFQGFDGPAPMRRAMVGAAMMGFGGMLAGGCAIGNGVTGTSIFAGTAWASLFFMWMGAIAADFLIDQRQVAVTA